MLFNLGLSNRTVYLSVDQVLEMSDLDYQSMIAGNIGEIINHPLYGSCLDQLSKEDVETITEEEEDEIEFIEENEDDHQLFSNEDLEQFLSNDSYGLPD